MDLTISRRVGSRNKRPPNLSRAVQRRCVFHSCFMLFMYWNAGFWSLRSPHPRTSSPPPSFHFHMCFHGRCSGGRESCTAPKGSAKMWLMPLLLTCHWPLEVTWLSLNSKGAGKCNPTLCPGCEEQDILVNSTKDGCNDNNE